MKDIKLERLRDKIQNIEVSYDYEDTYNKLYNACYDYMNETQDWKFEYIFDNYIDYELAEERAKYELEHGGLDRLSYFIGDARFYNEEIFRINGYGNLENISKEDLDNIKEEILYEIGE